MCVVCSNILFVAKRDGSSAAVAYARQTMKQYRKTVLSRKGLVERRKYILAYLTAKRYLFSNEQW